MRVNANISFKLNHNNKARAKILVEIAMNYALLKLSENELLTPAASVLTIDISK